MDRQIYPALGGRGVESDGKIFLGSTRARCIEAHALPGRGGSSPSGDEEGGLGYYSYCWRTAGNYCKLNQL